MDKKALEHQIKRYETVRDCAEERLKELKSYHRDLCEAEKPELGHGDFGIREGNLPRLTLQAWKGRVFSAGECCCESIDEGVQRHPEIIFGNIFDLMKGWGEDLIETKVVTEQNREIFLSNSGLWIGIKDTKERDQIGATLTLSEAEEIWRKLGQMIMTLKRKQQK